MFVQENCEHCQGTGKVEQGEFDNHIEVKCLCVEEENEDDNS